MNRKQEKACLENIQCYLDRMVDSDAEKVCALCSVFISRDGFRDCRKCPLGPKTEACMRESNYINFETSMYRTGFDNATKAQLKRRMNWLLERYKQAGLEIEIVEE